MVGYSLRRLTKGAGIGLRGKLERVVVVGTSVSTELPWSCLLPGMVLPAISEAVTVRTVPLLVSRVCDCV